MLKCAACKHLFRPNCSITTFNAIRQRMSYPPVAETETVDSSLTDQPVPRIQTTQKSYRHKRMPRSVHDKALSPASLCPKAAGGRHYLQWLEELGVKAQFQGEGHLAAFLVQQHGFVVLVLLRKVRGRVNLLALRGLSSQPETGQRQTIAKKKVGSTSNTSDQHQDNCLKGGELGCARNVRRQWSVTWQQTRSLAPTSHHNTIVHEHGQWLCLYTRATCLTYNCCAPLAKCRAIKYGVQSSSLTRGLVSSPYTPPHRPQRARESALARSQQWRTVSFWTHLERQTHQLLVHVVLLRQLDGVTKAVSLGVKVDGILHVVLSREPREHRLSATASRLAPRQAASARDGARTWWSYWRPM